MKKTLLFQAAASFALCFTSKASYAAEMDCQMLVESAPAGVQISASYLLADEQVNSAYCLVEGHMADRVGVDGRDYAINFELRLPDNWQGRFGYQFNGGNDGAVIPALGAVTGLMNSQNAINRGFAMVSSDGGHDGNANPEAGLVGGVLFGEDPEARRDYGYSALEKLNPVARALVENYYQSPILYAYGMGVSNGGRVAMVAASRYPDMFDGLLVGYPGFNLPKAALQHAWDIQQLRQVNVDISEALTRQDLSVLSKGIIEQCDALDGLEDGLVFASDRCQSVFELNTLTCDSDSDLNCLSADKISALIAMHQGPRNSAGQALYTDWLFDAGISSGNWRTWRVQSPIPPWGMKPISAVMGSGSLAYIFTTSPHDVAGDPSALEDFLFTFNFDEEAPKIYQTSSRFQQSTMDVMTPPDAANPTLESFKQNAGRMVIFHGNSDPVFSVQDTIQWYNSLDRNQGGQAENFVRFYRVPGMPHGQGGPSTDRFDMLSPLINWVENNEAPEAVAASTRADNAEFTYNSEELSRPLCVYPAYARYQSGDIRLSTSFVCE